MKNNIMRRITAIFIATFLIVGLVITTGSNIFLSNTLALWILAWVYLFLFFDLVALKLNLIKIKAKSSRIIMLGVASLAVSMVLLGILPWKYGTVLTNNHIEKQRHTTHSVTISVVGQNDASAGKEVWICAVKKNQEDYNMYEIALDNQVWFFNEGAIYTTGESGDELVIDLGEGNLFEVKMKKNPLSGIVKISSGQYEYSLDLYSNVEEEVYLDWDALYGRVTTANQYMRMGYYALYLAIVWSLVLAGTVLMLEKNDKKSELSNEDSKSKVEN